MATNKKELVDIHNRVTPSELEKIIKKNMTTIMNNPEMSMLIPPVIIRSSPGMGKSSIVSQVAKDLGIQFKSVYLNQCESVDIKGLPVPNHEKHVMDWYVNGTWPQDEKSFGILFLDELTSCSRDILCAAHELILERKLGDLYKLPNGWMIVAAGNLTTDRAVAMPMESAMANRLLHVQLDTSIENWTAWAQYNNVDPSVIGFLNYRPELMHKMEGQNLEMGWPSPRSWERVSTMVKMYGGEKREENTTLRKIVYGLVGNGAGVEFMEFYKINSQFDNVLDYMLDENKKIIIPERADAKYAIVSAMIYQLWRGKDENDETKRIAGFFRILNELTPDFGAMAMSSAMCGRSKEHKIECCNKLHKNPGYSEWVKKYGKTFHKKYNFD